MAIRNRVFRDYLDLYRGALRETRYAELRTLQPAPFASLGHGGAGTAYALWRLGETRRAKAWIAAALADRGAAAYDPEILADARRPSLMFGRPGGQWVAAMIAPAETGRYLRAIRTLPLDEHASGAAGHLLAACVLRRRASDVALARMIDRLGARLVTALRARVDAPWTARDAMGFAHGWVGICYAILAWAPPEPWIVDAVVALAARWAPDDTLGPFATSWCNGAAGALLLWTKAFSVTGVPAFVDVARRTARAALDGRGANQSLCCGHIGAAFALLALERVDPRRGWRAEARALAAEVIAAPRFAYPNGLFQGHPGLACLALDLVDEPRGFPAIEG